MGTRQVALTREIWIEQDDFMEDPPRKFFRLRPGGEVRLRNAFIIRCDEVIKDPNGQVVELHCSLDTDSRSGMPGAARKVKGTIHWVSALHAMRAEVRLYDRLFSVANPLADKDRDFLEFLNPDSLVVLSDARVEPAVAADRSPTVYQFERNGYFVQDPIDSQADRPVFNRAVSLRDTWAKIGSGK